MALSLQKLLSRMWAIQKEIKDAYPKKVCHMLTELVTQKKGKKEKKMHTQRRYATCPQGMSERKKKEKKIAHIQERREMVHDKEFIHHPPKKKKNNHTPHLDQGL